MLRHLTTLYHVCARLSTLEWRHEEAAPSYLPYDVMRYCIPSENHMLRHFTTLFHVYTRLSTLEWRHEVAAPTYLPYDVMKYCIPYKKHILWHLTTLYHVYTRLTTLEWRDGEWASLPDIWRNDFIKYSSFMNEQKKTHQKILFFDEVVRIWKSPFLVVSKNDFL